MKSGWCGFPLTDTKQHEGCKRSFGGSGYTKWDCACVCHPPAEAEGEVAENVKLSPEDRAAKTKGK